ncbi:hypothetical protein [Enterobacter sp. 168J2]|uniref:hypothetical protein n=1 Tax=Enterobacter sp. 168J2 TaxID=3077758 RepID=UPI0020A0C8A0|nr:hypothetical protein [Enterobacter sp. 168J2]MCP1114295.1 hypothetical protein [Enterobacter bugandensis]HBU6129651.1 hypothetical protein [Enterobacter cloacae]
MNIKLVMLLMVAGFNSGHAIAKDMFSGQWSGEQKNESTLTLRLNQVGQNVNGSYCYVTQNGNRIDCPPDDENNLKGVIAENRANVEFNSSFGGGKGHAKLEVVGDKMIWTLITPPQKGEYYAPQNYKLTKMLKSSTPEKRTFETEKFNITLVNKCGSFEIDCNSMFYLGIRKSDNSTISLDGKTFKDTAGKVTGSLFKNGEITYTVTYNPLKLVVSKGGHVLVDQPGQWVNK